MISQVKVVILATSHFKEVPSLMRLRNLYCIQSGEDLLAFMRAQSLLRDLTTELSLLGETEGCTIYASFLLHLNLDLVNKVYNLKLKNIQIS